MKVTFCRAIFKKKHGLTTIFFFLRKGKWVNCPKLTNLQFINIISYISKKRRKKPSCLLILLWTSPIDEIPGLTTAIIFKDSAWSRLYGWCFTSISQKKHMLQPLYTPMEIMGPKGSPPVEDMETSPSGTIIDLTLYVKFKTNTFS